MSTLASKRPVEKKIARLERSIRKFGDYDGKRTKALEKLKAIRSGDEPVNK